VDKEPQQAEAYPRDLAEAHNPGQDSRREHCSHCRHRPCAGGQYGQVRIYVQTVDYEHTGKEICHTVGLSEEVVLQAPYCETVLKKGPVVRMSKKGYQDRNEHSPVDCLSPQGLQDSGPVNPRHLPEKERQRERHSKSPW